MEVEEEEVLWQLLRPPAVTEKTLADILQTLWTTRRSGLDSAHKSRIQRLLALKHAHQLHRVLACLRLIMRKCADGEEINKLFVSAQLQTILVPLLRNFRNQWIREASTHHPISQQTRMPHNVKVNSLPSLPSVPTRELSSSLWERKDTTDTKDDNSQLTGESTINPSVAPGPLSQDTVSGDHLVRLPRLKSMTCTMQNKNSIPTKRVAIITLKLQDYSKSPNGETEVKCQLTKDTLEVLLQSLTCISEQLSSSVGRPSDEPSPKKQRQD